MVGLVIVSHSHALACGVVELAREMGGDDVLIAEAGGLDGPDHATGTDAVRIMAAIEEVAGPDGVVVLMDLGSAILSAEMALELLPPETAETVVLCPAPLVEGAVAAAVAAKIGQDRDAVAAEANRGLAGKLAHLGAAPAPGGEPGADAPDGGAWIERTLPVDTPMGLHARPAARLVQLVGAHGSEVRVARPGGDTDVDARSLTAIATLGITGGQTVLVRARGEDAERFLDAVDALAKAHWGDPPEPEAPPAPTETAGHSSGGVPASPGVAVGPARHLERPEPVVPDVAAASADAEHGELVRALEVSRTELEQVRAATRRQASEAEAAIFDTHLAMLDDPELLAGVRNAIDGGSAATMAWHDAVTALAERYSEMESPYLAARADDVREVGRRVLAHLVGDGLSPPTLSAPGVLVAAALSPADTATLDASLVKAIVTAEGGPTDHSAIIARGLGIPAVVGVGDWIMDLAPGTVLAVDGDTGAIDVDPDDAAVAAIERRAADLRAAREEARTAAMGAAITRDGVRIEVAGSIAKPQDAVRVADAGGDGVGLFRTEFLFMGRDAPPDEDEQAAAYRTAAQALNGDPLLLRTLDAGADKPLPYLGQADEHNPFLGARGIRLSLANPALFRTQLRAMLRVAVDHPLRIMFPMIAGVAEFRAARAILDDVRAELIDEGTVVRDDLQVGVMVEVPSAALTAAHLAREVAFFSVGTNDLTQYTLAAERGNAAVASLSDPLHPAVLRLIGLTCEAANAHGRWVGVCGEVASDAAAVPLLLGLGVRELAANAPSIPTVKAAVRDVDLGAAAELARRALDLEDAAQVRGLVASSD
ncbi:MAG: phosphoenolpyruvate--protein phosphotransferase [Actinobacteria bacterium]|nr:phosphoenolpyruvate--protein phosphotransferase [Thermoleophilia bacterium]MCB9011970.1 phosphoenolpyruvate--protein phosphotransferase [Actinomycetota bacterium]